RWRRISVILRSPLLPLDSLDRVAQAGRSTVRCAPTKNEEEMHMTYKLMPGRSLSRLVAAAAVVAMPLAFGPTALAKDTIRFGAPLPLTGALAPEALKQQQG